MFGRVFSMFMSFSTLPNETLSLAKKIYDDCIEHIEVYNIEDVSKLVN